MKPREVFAMLALLAAVAGIVALVGAAQRGARQAQALAPPAVNWDAVADDAATTLTISWLGIPRFATAPPGTWIERILERRFNVEFEPVFLDNNGFAKRKPLMFCAGDVPDVYLNYDPIHVQRDVYHGFALELPYDVIKRHAPRYLKNLNESGAVAWIYSYWNGRNYGLPTHGVENLMPTPGVWRMDWLRRVGIEKIPETLDEMRAALRAFRDGDPDGNGRRDTYGFCPTLSTWSLAFSEIFGAFGVLPFDWMERDGRVVWGGLLPETRETLALLREWNREGFIDPDFVSSTREQERSKLVSGRVGYGNCFGLYNNMAPELPTSLVNEARALSPGAELVTGWFPLGPRGQRGGRAWTGGGHVICFNSALAREPGGRGLMKVIRTLKLFDAIAADEELFLQTRVGQRGVMWDFTDERGVYLLPPYDGRGQDKRHLLNVTLSLPAGFYSPCGPTLEVANKYLPRALREYNATYRKIEWALCDVFGKPDVVPSAADYLGDLRQMQLTAFAEIIRGDKPIEHFETFTANWRKQGGDKLTAEANDLLAAMKRIYREVGVEQ